MVRAYSTRLGAGETTPGESVVYTVPPGNKAVVLAGQLMNVGTGDAELTFWLRLNTGLTLPIRLFGVNGNTYEFDWSGRVVLNGGDSLVLTGDGQYSYILSGYLFLA